jgi:hypothetical protein
MKKVLIVAIVAIALVAGGFFLYQYYMNNNYLADNTIAENTQDPKAEDYFPPMEDGDEILIQTNKKDKTISIYNRGGGAMTDAIDPLFERIGKESPPFFKANYVPSGYSKLSASFIDFNAVNKDYDFSSKTPIKEESNNFYTFKFYGDAGYDDACVIGLIYDIEKTEQSTASTPKTSFGIQSELLESKPDTGQYSSSPEYAIYETDKFDEAFISNNSFFAIKKLDVPVEFYEFRNVPADYLSKLSEFKKEYNYLRISVGSPEGAISKDELIKIIEGLEVY